MPRSRRTRTMSPTEQLRNFLDAATELETHQFVQQGMHTELTLSWDQEGLRIKPDTPSRALLVECFTAVRQYAFNDRDLVFLDTIFNLCEQHITDAGLREHARFIRQSWTNVKRNTYMRVHVSESPDDPGRAVTPTEIGELWEGHIFHGDPKSREALATMDPVLKAMLDNLFHNFLFGTVEVVLYTASFLSHVLDNGFVSDERVP